MLNLINKLVGWKTKMLRKYRFLSFLILNTLILGFLGCGKNEGTAGALGAASGAILGSAVTNKKNRAAGAVIGALAGNLLFREVGKAQDQEEEELKEQKEYYKSEVIKAQNENRRLKENMSKWCLGCHRKVTLVGAHSCPHCGDELIVEKYCKFCLSKFSPDSSYKFCPYCKERVLLAGR